MAHAQFTRETARDGSWKRQTSAFRSWVRADGSTPHAPAAGRYHLYVSLACPWAHRSIIARRLKGLEGAIGMTVVDPLRDDRGWRFGDGSPGGGEADPLHGWSYLAEGYLATDDGFDGRVTVPALWDRRLECVVTNESSDIVRMLGAEFDDLAERPELSLYPEGMRDEIDTVNEWVYETVNDGVYRCGFATTQEAYAEAFDSLFASLDRIEGLLGERRYLAGDQITEADWRLFTTLVRFDAVYHGHFKCNLRRIVDYPRMWPYLRELYQVPGVAETVDFDHIKRHYYMTHDRINPTRIVPRGPALELGQPHGRR